MNDYILNEAKKFLISYLKDKKICYEMKHPWRKNWEYIALHSLRVESYVKRIFEGENHRISDKEKSITQLAAILHDIGRIHEIDGHALISRSIVNQWLENNHSIVSYIAEPQKLLDLIEKHSDKRDMGEHVDYCLKVLRDADVLDEIGVMSIFMASNWIDSSNPYFFKLLSERVGGFEVDFCSKGFELLNTDTAKRILNEKREFLVQFDNQLKDELSGTEDFGEVGLEEFFLESGRL